MIALIFTKPPRMRHDGRAARLGTDDMTTGREDVQGASIENRRERAAAFRCRRGKTRV